MNEEEKRQMEEELITLSFTFSMRDWARIAAVIDTVPDMVLEITKTAGPMPEQIRQQVQTAQMFAHEITLKMEASSR